MTLSRNQSLDSSDEITQMNKVSYKPLVGSIIHAMLFTRHDVYYAISMTSQYQQNPGDDHWVADKNF